MVKNDLIDRYIYAVTKHMKSAMKKDVAAELETIIQDMLEERCGDVTPTERDIKVVLTELGTPAELSSKYKGETQDCLIGQPYYSLYVYVLKIVRQWGNAACSNYGSINIAYDLVYSDLSYYWRNFGRYIDGICSCDIAVCILL